MIRPQTSSSLLLQSLCLRFLYFSLLISANESTNTCTLLHVIGGCGTPHGKKNQKNPPLRLPVRLRSSLEPSGLQSSVL